MTLRPIEGWLGPFPLAAAALLVAGSLVLGYQVGRMVSERRHRQLATRNRELDLLRGLAQTLLGFRSPNELFEQVARVALDLMKAGGSAVLLRPPEGDFLRIAAGAGQLGSMAGRLLPITGSFAGAALTEPGPIRTARLSADSRNHQVAGLPAEFERAAAIALRARQVTIGVVAVYAGADRAPFSDLDLELLQTLEEQMALGLDRAAMLEDARRNELVLEQANQELLQATELKNQFMANMSHELRTPLNAIIGFSDLILEEPNLDETHRDYLASISRNGKHLLEQISGVLDVAKLEAGRMTLYPTRFDLRPVIEAATNDTASLRRLKNQSCRVETGTASLELVADQTKVRQILFNLLSNASKFTDPAGAVLVEATRTQMPLPNAPDQTNSVVVRDSIWVGVRDTGIGVPPQEATKLFQPFRQVDSSATRSQPGTGLGLALCKRFVELHGGSIGVESEVGRGSTFWFALPVEGPPGPFIPG